MKTCRRISTRLSVESLEARMLLSISPGQTSVDLVACEVHDHGGRSRRPFMAEMTAARSSRIQSR